MLSRQVGDLGAASGSSVTFADIGVVGAGVMGRGVTVALCQAGLRVVLLDRSPDVMERSRRALYDDIRTFLLVSRTASLTVDDILSRVRFGTDLEQLAGVDLVIENVTEKWEVKKPVYEQIDAICRPETIFGVNTSAIPITRLAALTRRPDRIIGMHFMNPAALKPTVEVIRGAITSDETLSTTLSFLASIGKKAIVVNDSPGFVTNRVMMLTINEAVSVLQENVATASDIDCLFVQCFGHKLGPLATADLIGLDTVLHSIEVLCDELGPDKFRPSPLLQEMVGAGLYGRKSGKGFFDYGSTS